MPHKVTLFQPSGSTSSTDSSVYEFQSDDQLLALTHQFLEKPSDSKKLKACLADCVDFEHQSLSTPQNISTILGVIALIENDRISQNTVSSDSKNQLLDKINDLIRITFNDEYKIKRISDQEHQQNESPISWLPDEFQFEL